MMLRQSWILLSALVPFVSPALVATAQIESRPADFHPGQSASTRWVSLPTDRNLRMEGGFQLYQTAPPVSSPSNDLQQWYQPSQPHDPPVDLKALMRPRVDVTAEWEPEVDGLTIGSYDLSIKMPVYPIFGPPPPFITTGYSFTQVDAPAVLDRSRHLS